MLELQKSPEKLRLLVLATTIGVLILGAIGCSGNASVPEASFDKGDEKRATDKIAEADTLYQGRTDMAKARVAVAALRQAQTADYGNYEAAWKLSRASFYVGDHAANDDERDEMFKQGIEAGKAAVKLQPGKPEGHFWLGANYGGTAAHSTLASLSSVQDIKGEMEAVIKIDEKYQGASAYLGLGRLYLQAPKVLGGDTAKAIEYLQKGVKLSANNSLMRYHLAEAYMDANRDSEALKELDALNVTPPDPEYLPEHKDALAKGQKLRDKIAAQR